MDPRGSYYMFNSSSVLQVGNIVKGVPVWETLRRGTTELLYGDIITHVHGFRVHDLEELLDAVDLDPTEVHLSVFRRGLEVNLLFLVTNHFDAADAVVCSVLPRDASKVPEEDPYEAWGNPKKEPKLTLWN